MGTKEITDLITIEELAEDIDNLVWEQGVTCFKVTECNTRRDYSYLVRGLHVEIEDDYVYCEDVDDIIITNMYGIMALLRACILCIKRIITNDVPRGELYLKSGGMVLIEIIE